MAVIGVCGALVSDPAAEVATEAVTFSSITARGLGGGPHWESKLLGTVTGVLGPRERALGREGDEEREEAMMRGAGSAVGRCPRRSLSLR